MRRHSSAFATCNFFLPSAMAKLFSSCFNWREFLSLMRRRFFIKPSLAAMATAWNDIPNDLMYLIATKSGLSDRQSLAGVCKSWAAMKEDHLSDIKELPWFVLPHQPESPQLRCLNLSQGTIESLNLPGPLRDGTFMGSTNGWLVFFKIEHHPEEEILKEALVFLFNPVTRRLLKLPPFPKTPCYQQWIFEEDTVFEYLNRIAISSNLVKESTVIAAIFCTGLELAICKPGDQQWTIFTGDLDLESYANTMYRFLLTRDNDGIVYYTDILFHDETLIVLVDLTTHHDQSSHPRNNRDYVLDSVKIKLVNSFIVWDGEHRSESCSECLIISNPIADQCVGYLTLATSAHGELLLIVRWAVCKFQDDRSFYENTKKISIIKLEIHEDHGVRASTLNDIGDQVIFLARFEARAMDSTRFNGVQGNCIYFVGDSFFDENEDGDYSFVCRESGVYNLRDGKVVRSLPSSITSYDFRQDWFLPIYRD